jgi:hypothetical protein
MQLIVLRGLDVLDLTEFASKHPGGQKVLYALAGKDISSEFEKVGHSQAARRLADSFLIDKFDVKSINHSSDANADNTFEYVNDFDSAAYKFHAERRAEMLRRYPEIETLIGKDWFPWLYGTFCMVAIGAKLISHFPDFP